MDNALQQIDFYVLANTDFMGFACRLLEKAYQEKARVYVYMENEDKACELNNLLWTFRDISFIPHHLVNDPETIAAPISISHLPPQTDDAQHYEILLILSSQLPENYQAFQRLILIVPEIEAWKNAARTHYKQLTLSGYTINTHKIG